MAESFTRPPGIPFKFAGVNTKSPADKLAPGKYAMAQNIRAYDDETIRVRPGLAQLSTSWTGLPVQNIRAYSTLETNNAPRYLFKSGTNIYLDTGEVVDTGYAAGTGVSLIPYRPNQSPGSWMYAGDNNQYRKLSAPDSTNTVTAQNAGIVEPQVPVDAYVIGAASFVDFLPSGTPTAGGTAGAPSAPTSPTTDTVGAHFVLGGVEEYIQVSNSIPYHDWYRMTINGVTTIILDSFPPVQSLIIAGIYYYAGTTGRCVVVPIGLGQSPGTSGQTSIYNPNFVQSLRRGAMVQIDSEVCLVLGTSIGPDGTISFETSTVSNHTVESSLTGVASLRIRYIGTSTGAEIIAASNGYLSNVASGIGTLSYSLSNNPFNIPTMPFQPEDYVHIGFLATNTAAVNEIKIIFDVGVGTVDYETDIYYYSVRPNDLTQGLVNSTTQLGVAQIIAQRSEIDREAAVESGNQGTTVSSAQMSAGSGSWSEILFPISSLTRVGAESQQTLQNCRAVRILYNMNASSLMIYAATYLVGGGQIDVGQVGAPYKYIVRPRSSLTGAKGNPSPVMRYGVSPRRDNLNIALPTTYPDPQMDMWDVFRFGGALDSYVYVGSSPLADGTFLDQYSDLVVESNDKIEYDNFEPWPSIGPPISGTAAVVGTTMVVTLPLPSSDSTAAPTLRQIGSMLPGNLIQSGQQVYTLWTRPTLIVSSGTTQTWLFQLVESAGVSLASPISFESTSGTVNAIDYASKITFNTGQYEFNSSQLRTKGGVPPGTVTDYVIAHNFGLSVPSGMNVVGVQVDLNWIGQSAGTGVLSGVALYHGGVPIGTTKAPNIPNSASPIDSVLGGLGDSWGATLTPAITNDATFGFGVQITTELVGETDRSFLNYFTVTIYYAPTPVQTTVAVTVNEPAVARQILPYLWGPTEQGGNLFGCGDKLRPGFVYFCKNFNPDSAPDSYVIELCPPSEPLLGGEVLDGTSFAASTDRWWQMRPSFGSESQYTPIEAPVGRGLAAPFGLCTDGSKIYFVAKDGIYAHAGGSGESLTDGDIYTLFPHEGIPGRNHTYNGVTLYAPDYSRSDQFRLAYCNNYLYFDYQDTTGNPRTLVYDVRHAGWHSDVNVDQVTSHYAIEQEEGSNGSLYGLLVMGSASGNLYQEADNSIDAGQPIQWCLATLETTAGDFRALKLFGDSFVDILSPTPSAGTNPITVTPLSLGGQLEPPVAINSVSGRQQLPIDLQGGLYAFSLGMFFAGTVNTATPDPVTLFTWQPSYIIKPETTATRAQDWDNAGVAGAKWMQGFILEANTFNAQKALGVRSSDDLGLKQTFQIAHNGQSEIAYSFDTPFVSHMVRLEPQDAVDWMLFGVRWVFEPTPETVTNWQTQGTALGWSGYGHVYSLNVAYAATSPITFQMTYDGTALTYTLPSTGGVYTKAFVNVAANKGKIYTFRFSATTKFQLWLDDFVIEVGGWGRTDAYRNYFTVGGSRGDKAQI